MQVVKLWFGRWDRVWTLFNVLSVEFEIEPKVYTFEEFEEWLRWQVDDFRMEIRYGNEPYGLAGEMLKRVLALFDELRAERGEGHFDYVMLPREEVTLDLRRCRYLRDIYGELREKMEWADFYGENFDALWDILTGMPYKGDDFIILRPRHYVGIPHGKNEGFTEYVDKLCAIFKEAQEKQEITVEVRYLEENES